MTREEFDTCPKCGIGKMKPTGGAASATSADPERKVKFTKYNLVLYDKGRI